MECVCGHQDDEHDWTASSGKCEVEGCPCFCFEPASGEGELDG